MDAQTRLAMARMRQDRSARSQSDQKTKLGVGIGDGGLKEFADSMDRMTGDDPGTTWKRHLLKQEQREAKGDSDLDYAGQHHGGAGCNSCGGYGWAPMVQTTPDGETLRGVSQCMECDHWEAAIEAGAAKYTTDKEYRKRIETRSREFFDGGHATFSLKNPVAAAIMARGREAAALPKRKGRTSFGDL